MSTVVDAPLPGETSAHVIDVWLIDHACLNQTMEIALTDLSAGERRRASEFVNAQALHSFVMSRWAFRAILAMYLAVHPRDVILSANEHGKPELRHRPPYANLSHTRNVTVVVTSGQAPVGVDLEHQRAVPDCSELSQRVMSDLEQATFSSFNLRCRERKFLELWTKKEALLKCKGTGFAKNPRDVCIGWDRDLVEFEQELYLVSGFCLGCGLICAIASTARFRLAFQDPMSICPNSNGIPSRTSLEGSAYPCP